MENCYSTTPFHAIWNTHFERMLRIYPKASPCYACSLWLYHLLFLLICTLYKKAIKGFLCIFNVSRIQSMLSLSWLFIIPYLCYCGCLVNHLNCGLLYSWMCPWGSLQSMRLCSSPLQQAKLTLNSPCEVSMSNPNLYNFHSPIPWNLTFFAIIGLRGFIFSFIFSWVYTLLFFKKNIKFLSQ